MSFAENLIELRKYNNLSQEELAEKINVSRQTLSKYETGESLPDIEKCKLLAEVFNIKPGDNLVILGDENQGLAIIKEKGLLQMLNKAMKYAD